MLCQHCAIFAALLGVCFDCVKLAAGSIQTDDGAEIECSMSSVPSSTGHRANRALIQQRFSSTSGIQMTAPREEKTDLEDVSRVRNPSNGHKRSVISKQEGWHTSIVKDNANPIMFAGWQTRPSELAMVAAISSTVTLVLVMLSVGGLMLFSSRWKTNEVLDHRVLQSDPDSTLNSELDDISDEGDEEELEESDPVPKLVPVQAREEDTDKMSEVPKLLPVSLQANNSQREACGSANFERHLDQNGKLTESHGDATITQTFVSVWTDEGHTVQRQRTY